LVARPSARAGAGFVFDRRGEAGPFFSITIGGLNEMIRTGINVKEGNKTFYLDDPKERQRYTKYMTPRPERAFCKILCSLRFRSKGTRVMVQENANEMNPSEALDDQEIVQTQDEQEIDPAEIDPAELAQEAAMDCGYFDGQIPADIPAPTGLSPKRAELVRFMEWRRRTVAELEHLEEAHHRGVEALGGERVTKKKIDALIEADVGEVLKFALGGEAITATKLRAFERHQLDQKLKADKHAWSPSVSGRSAVAAGFRQTPRQAR
jgi:hypothetical protein